MSIYTYKVYIHLTCSHITESWTLLLFFFFFFLLSLFPSLSLCFYFFTPPISHPPHTGTDTKSKILPHKIARRLQKENIILDAVNVDQNATPSGNILHQIAKATRGYSFFPTSLRDALKLNELELFLSCKDRAR